MQNGHILPPKFEMFIISGSKCGRRQTLAHQDSLSKSMKDLEQLSHPKFKTLIITFLGTSQLGHPYSTKHLVKGSPRLWIPGLSFFSSDWFKIGFKGWRITWYKRKNKNRSLKLALGRFKIGEIPVLVSRRNQKMTIEDRHLF